MNLVFLGKQGVGKGTYAQRFGALYGIPQVSTGDLFRQEVATGSEIGKKIGQIINSGSLVPDDIASEVLQKRLQQPDCANGFILDGFPRNENQAHILHDALKKIHKKIDAAVNFTAEDEILLKRLTSRRQCQNCNRIYNLLTIKPKKDGVCDLCGGPLFHREDDREDAIKKRFAIYEAQTKPLTEYYKLRDLLVEIDGSRGQEEVVEDLVAILKKRLGS